MRRPSTLRQGRRWRRARRTLEHRLNSPLQIAQHIRELPDPRIGGIAQRRGGENRRNDGVDLIAGGRIDIALAQLRGAGANPLGAFQSFVLRRRFDDEPAVAVSVRIIRSEPLVSPIDRDLRHFLKLSTVWYGSRRAQLGCRSATSPRAPAGRRRAAVASVQSNTTRTRLRIRHRHIPRVARARNRHVTQSSDSHRQGLRVAARGVLCRAVHGARRTAAVPAGLARGTRPRCRGDRTCARAADDRARCRHSAGDARSPTGATRCAAPSPWRRRRRSPAMRSPGW